LPQGTIPDAHSGMQAPSTHRNPAGQALPQPLQFFALVARSTQPLPGQWNVLPGQKHCPCWHICPSGQTFPQAPQLSASVERRVQPPGQGVCSASAQVHWPSLQV
jgi:hypothetical protein